MWQIEFGFVQINYSNGNVLEKTIVVTWNAVKNLDLILKMNVECKRNVFKKVYVFKKTVFTLILISFDEIHFYTSKNVLEVRCQKSTQKYNHNGKREIIKGYRFLFFYC